MAYTASQGAEHSHTPLPRRGSDDESDEQRIGIVAIAQGRHPCVIASACSAQRISRSGGTHA